MTTQAKVKKEYVPLEEIQASDVFKLLHSIADLPYGTSIQETTINPELQPETIVISGSALEEAILYLAGRRDLPPSSKVDVQVSVANTWGVGITPNSYELMNEETQRLEAIVDGHRVPVLDRYVPTAYNGKVPEGMNTAQVRKVAFRNEENHFLGEVSSFGNTRLFLTTNPPKLDKKLQEVDLNCSQVALRYRLAVNSSGDIELGECALSYTSMFKDFMATQQIIPTNLSLPVATVARALKKKRLGYGYFESTRYVELVKLAQQLYATGTLRRLYLTNPEDFKTFSQAFPHMKKFTDNIASTFKVKNGLSWMLKCSFPSRPLTGQDDDWFQEDYPIELVTQLANKLAITQDGVRQAPIPSYLEHQVAQVEAETELAEAVMFKRDAGEGSNKVVQGISFGARAANGFSAIPTSLNSDTKLLSTMFTLIVRPDAQKTLTQNARGYKGWTQVLKHEQQFWNYKGVAHSKESHALNDLVLRYYENIGIAHCLFESRTVTPYELMMISQRLTEVSYDRAERLIALFGMYMQRPQSTSRPDFAYSFFLKRDNGLLGKFTLEDARYALKHIYLHTEAIEFLLGYVHPANWRKVHQSVIENSQKAGLLNTHYALYMQMHRILTPEALQGLSEVVDDQWLEQNVSATVFDYLDMRTKEGVLIFNRHRVPLPNQETMNDLKVACGNIPELLVEEIVMAEDLKKEGEYMRHCVGGYSDSVKSSTCRIIRYRGKGTTDSATAEWRFRRTGGTWSISLQQIRAHANRDPIEQVKALDRALRDYVCGIINENDEVKASYGFLAHIDR